MVQPGVVAGLVGRPISKGERLRAVGPDPARRCLRGRGETLCAEPRTAKRLATVGADDGAPIAPVADELIDKVIGLRGANAGELAAMRDRPRLRFVPRHPGRGEHGLVIMSGAAVGGRPPDGGARNQFGTASSRPARFRRGGQGFERLRGRLATGENQGGQEGGKQGGKAV